MTNSALIVAAGRGNRLGGTVPKQYLRIGGETVLARSLRALLHPDIDLVQLVIHPDDADRCREACADIHDPRVLAPVAGGEDRRASVLAGLEALRPHDPRTVLIHDAARPGLNSEIIPELLAALEEVPGALPALPVVDALWIEENGRAVTEQSRERLWRAQTPQAFRFREILAAHLALVGPANDDVAVARAAGIEVRIVQGSEEAFKITTAADIVRARQMFGDGMDIRTGNGFDVHAFEPGDAVILCGVPVAFDRRLAGHSDADVGLHALTDAVFGALAEGDIGQWFPPSDPQWKGAASRVFLEKAMDRVATRGFTVTNLDLTLICEAPKIGPHAAAMRGEVSRITGVEIDRISVKATTSERLGFTGRGEGIAALATATLVKT